MPVRLWATTATPTRGRDHRCPPRSPGPGLLGLLALVTLAACGPRGGPERAPETAEVSDSGGVIIVVNHRGELPPPGRPALRLAPVPELEIDGGGEPFEEIVGVILRPNGHLVIADGGASVIREYDTAGRLVGAVGRAGEGPGEFRLLTGIGAGKADTIWAYDFALRRFMVLGPDLAVARHLTLGPGLSAVSGVGMTDRGEFIVRESFAVPSPDQLTEGLRRDRVAIVRLDTAARIRDTIATLPGREVVIRDEGGRAVMSAPLVAHQASVAFADSAIVIGDQERYELRVVGLDGTTRRIIRREVGDLTLDRAILETLREERLALTPAAERAVAARQLATMPVPQRRPAFGEALVGRDGTIWVAEWAPGERAPTTWAVFRPDGTQFDVIAMPSGFRPAWADADRAVGIHRDALGRERVRVYRLLRE